MRDISVRILRLITAFALASAVASCAISNEGAVDFRRAGLPAHNADITAFRALPLEIKNFSAGRDTRIKELDSVSVHLKTAFIGSFFEIPINPLRNFEANGEIAIVANVFEIDNEHDFQFANDEVGRLVFYSADVSKKQFLNMNNLPIYGPVEYHGGPLGLRITIFELDESSSQAKAVLEALAKSGEIARVLPHPITPLLNGLGRTLLSGSQNDIEFRYTMAVDPNPGHELIAHAPLEVGNYVFVRSENRAEPIPWEDLTYDDNIGRLKWRFDGADYTDNTYIVVEVNRNVSSKHLDLSQNTYAEFLQKIREQDDAAAQNLTPTIDALIAASTRRAQVQNFNTAKELIAKVGNFREITVERAAAATKLLGLFAKSLDPATGKLRRIDAAYGVFPALNERQIEYLAAQLRRIADGDVGEAMALLNSPRALADPERAQDILRLLLGETAVPATSDPNGQPRTPVDTKPLIPPTPEQTEATGELFAVARRVRESGASYPLEQFALGDDAARTLVRDFGSTTYFRDHMSVLMDEGLVSCSSSDFASCRITEKGRNVGLLISPR